MPETQEIVINTGPIIAIVAALGGLDVLKMYKRVCVPFEVCSEVTAGESGRFAASEFEAAQWLDKWEQPLSLHTMLLNTLDAGEASVIQLALNERIRTVCIDERVGRRMARLNGLQVTGSVGILLRSRREGHSFSMREALQRMKSRGIWLSQTVEDFALREAGE
jgi:predicted nucleic acid-binding protein